MHENNLPKQFEYDLTQVATIDDYLTELNRQQTEYQDITDLVINKQLTVSIASKDFNAIISVIKGLPMPLRRIGGKYLDINLKDQQLDVTFAAFDFLNDIDSSISNDKFTEFSNAITDFRNAVHALSDAQKAIAQEANNESSITRPDESKKASEVQNKPSTANESQSGLSDTNTLDQILTDADKKQAANKDDDIMPPLSGADEPETTNNANNDITNYNLAAYLNNIDGDDLDLDDTDEQDSTSSSTSTRNNPDTSQDSAPESNTNDDIMPALDDNDTQNEEHVNDDLPDIDGADSEESEQYDPQYETSEENVDDQESVNDDLPSINETNNSADNINNSNDNADQESTEMPETLTEPKVEHDDTNESTNESANESTNVTETNPVHSSIENVDQSTNINQESNTTNPVNVTPGATSGIPGTTATSDTQSAPVQNSNINTASQPNQVINQVSNQVQAQPPAQTAGLPQINNQSANQILKLLYAGFNQLIAGVVQEVQKQNNAAQTNNQPPQQSTPKQPDEDPLDAQYNQLKSENDKQIALLLRNMSDNDNIAQDDENPDN